MKQKLLDRMMWRSRTDGKVERKKRCKKIGPKKLRQEKMQHSNAKKKKLKSTVQNDVYQKRIGEEHGKAQQHARDTFQ